MNYWDLVIEQSKRFDIVKEDLLPTNVVDLAMHEFKISGFVDSLLLGEAHLAKRRGKTENWFKEKYFENSYLFSKSEENFRHLV
jgi:hypothetical protein